MDDKPEINRTSRTSRNASSGRAVLLVCAALALPAAVVPASAQPASAQPADRRLELRQRLDSLEVEKQMRKRQGKPIDDLEAATLDMRDSLLDLRLADPAPDAGRQTSGKWGGLSLSAIPLLGDALAFRPTGAFDWIIVGTGFMALLSGLMLVIGIVAGMKKKAAGPKRKAVGKKVDLSPTGPRAAVGMGGVDSDAGPQLKYGQGEGGAKPPFEAGATYGHNGRMDGAAGAARRDSGIPDDLQTLVEHLRRVAPPQQQPPAPPTTAPPPPAPPSPPPPLFVNAPDEPPAPPPVRRPPAPPAHRSAPTASALPELAPPEPDISGQELSEIGLSGAGWSGPPPAGAGTPAFNDLVVAASNSGLGDVDISKRYKISVDQVRLILRMKQK